MASALSKLRQNQKMMEADMILEQAEVSFSLNRFDSAIEQARKVKALNENLLVDNNIKAYEIHKAMWAKENWYVILNIPDRCDFSIVKKGYKELVRYVHPDKNPSLAADGAFKHIKEALDFLQDPLRKKRYDNSLASAAAHRRAERKRRAANETTEREAAKKAAREAKVKKEAKEAAAAAKKAAEEANELEAELVAAARKLAAEKSRKANVGAKKEEARKKVAAAKEPMSEIEYSIQLLLKHSPNYMPRKFSVW